MVQKALYMTYCKLLAATGRCTLISPPPRSYSTCGRRATALTCAHTMSSTELALSKRVKIEPGDHTLDPNATTLTPHNPNPNSNPNPNPNPNPIKS